MLCFFKIKDNFINAEKSILVIGRFDEFSTVHCTDTVRLKLMGRILVTAFYNGVRFGLLNVRQ